MTDDVPTQAPEPTQEAPAPVEMPTPAPEETTAPEPAPSAQDSVEPTQTAQPETPTAQMGRSEPFATSLQEQYTLRLFCSLCSKTARKVLRSFMHSLRSPAAHSIFKNPREMDVHACPPLAERIGGGAGAGTESNRTTPVQSHHAREAREHQHSLW